MKNFTVKEISEELGLSKSRVLQYINTGKLKAEWAGNQLLISASRLQRFRDSYFDSRSTGGRPQKEIE